MHFVPFVISNDPPLPFSLSLSFSPVMWWWIFFNLTRTIFLLLSMHVNYPQLPKCFHSPSHLVLVGFCCCCSFCWAQRALGNNSKVDTCTRIHRMPALYTLNILVLSSFFFIFFFLTWHRTFHVNGSLPYSAEFFSALYSDSLFFLLFRPISSREILE